MSTDVHIPGKLKMRAAVPLGASESLPQVLEVKAGARSGPAAVPPDLPSWADGDELRFLGPGNQAASAMGQYRAQNERIERRRDLSDEEKWRAISANNARIRELARRMVERDEEARKARTPAGGARRAQDDSSALLRAIRQGVSSEALP